MRTTGTAADWFLDCTHWCDEVALLREIVLAAGLEETLKWGQPAYVAEGRNIALVSHQKAGAVLSFLSGALLQDPEGCLITPGVSRHSRFLQYASVAEIRAQRPYVDALLAQAVQVARDGLRVPPLPDEIDYIDELQERLAADPEFCAAFEALTPGRRRAYNHHFGGSKNASTREARITRYTERILMGKGMLDCVCGHSKRPPGCDGTHKDYA